MRQLKHPMMSLRVRVRRISTDVEFDNVWRADNGEPYTDDNGEPYWTDPVGVWFTDEIEIWTDDNGEPYTL